MTILTSKLTDRKDDNPSPEVVDSDYALLINGDVTLKPAKKSVVVNIPSQQTVIINRRQRSVWIALIGLFVFLIITIGCVCLYKNLLSDHEKYAGRCGVRYRYNPDTNPSYMDRLRAEGEFEEYVEIDNEYEKIVVPKIGDTRRATILHDFNVNYTAIIDKEQGHCFMMPLNRSLVLPPEDLKDLLIKLKADYYVPDTNVVRENYRVVEPVITDYTEFGVYIFYECRYYDSYKLVREGEPIAMSKRAACEFAGSEYSLGDAGRDTMLMFKIVGCQ